MEPYKRKYRRKLPILDPLPRAWTEWQPAPAPIPPEEVAKLGELSMQAQPNQLGLILPEKPE